MGQCRTTVRWASAAALRLNAVRVCGAVPDDRRALLVLFLICLMGKHR
jgi:hypothetical protein